LENMDMNKLFQSHLDLYNHFFQESSNFHYILFIHRGKIDDI
jgi:hypothetical protein